MSGVSDASVEEVVRRFGSAEDVPYRWVRAPYRLSPLGAHTDHQDGLTSGFTIDRGITMTWRPTDAGEVRVASKDYPGDACVSIARDNGPPADDWTAYVQGVVGALARDHVIVRGIEGVVAGELPPGGISSSAALQVAVLLAVAEANGLKIETARAVELVRIAEQASTGVAVGVLDPTTILNGKERALVMIDCKDGAVRYHRVARRTPPFTWFLVDSGVPRQLKETPYNDRVAECREAARRLGSEAEVPALAHIAPETYRRRRKELPPTLVRRAEHYFSEVKRVKLGSQALSSGDMVALGRLMWASADSLTQNFECGTPETRALLSELRSGEGVFGASYAGAGWGGMVQVLAEPTARGSVERCVAVYRDLHPVPGSSSTIYEVGMGPGAHIS